MKKTRFEIGIEHLKNIDGTSSCESQLEVHIAGALHVGLSQEKIIEIFGYIVLFFIFAIGHFRYPLQSNYA